MSSLVLYIVGMTEDHPMGSDEEDELPSLQTIEADLKMDLASPDNKQVDLFSEIHLNEIKKLEKQLELVGSTIILFECILSVYFEYSGCSYDVLSHWPHF